MKRTLITGSGCYIPEVIKRNTDFLDQPFYGEDGQLIKTEPAIIVDKFQKITGIAERRYLASHQNTSDIAAAAGARAIEGSQLDPESLDLLIVAHNFGDVPGSHFQAITTFVSAMPNSKKRYRLQFPTAVELVDFLSVTNLGYTKLNFQEKVLIADLIQRDAELAVNVFNAEAELVEVTKQ